MLVEAEVASAVDVCYMGIAYIRPPYDALLHPLKTCGAEGWWQELMEVVTHLLLLCCYTVYRLR